MRTVERLLVLGAGYTGLATLRAAAAQLLGTAAVVRREAAAAPLRALGHEVDVAASFATAADAIAARADEKTLVAVLFPPDGATDAALAAAFAARARERRPSIAYVSSTGVYGDRPGMIDDATPVTASPSAIAAKRLDAERTWRALDATILRAPAIYGPDRGLHVRIAEGKHLIPGDGSGHVSRIHVDDLAALVLASPRAPGEVFVVGDVEPAPHREVVAFVCATHGLPMPPFAPLDEVHESLRGDRRIDASRALAMLSVTLAHASYRTGMATMRR